MLGEMTFLRQFYRIEPELADASIMLDMNVGRLASVATCEEKSERTNDLDGWHVGILS